MTADAYPEFLANIARILKKNGFPTQRVALPLERMYEVAHEKKLNFNKALDLLLAQGIAHEKSNTRITFFPRADEPVAATPPAVDPADPLAMFASLDKDALGGMNKAEMMAQASAMMQNLSPENRAQIENLVRTMSDEQKSDMMKKAKDLGLA